jgi:hypothetical protein
MTLMLIHKTNWTKQKRTAHFVLSTDFIDSGVATRLTSTHSNSFSGSNRIITIL